MSRPLTKRVRKRQAIKVLESFSRRMGLFRLSNAYSRFMEGQSND